MSMYLMNAAMVSYETRKAKILAAVEHAAHYLPSQGPIQVFVHHNTLHAFESEKFEEAVLLGKEHFGGEPYWSEARYHRELEFGRISRDDLQAELQQQTEAGGNPEILAGLSRNRLRMAMLSAPIKDVSKSQLDWLVTETLGELPRFLFEQSEQTLATEWYACRENPIKARKLLRDLYEACRENTVKWPSGIHGSVDDSPLRYTRPNQLVSHLYGLNLDGLVNELLIRFCAAYLDQGFAGLQLPARETGLWSSFIELYSAPFSLLPDWAKSLKEELKRVRRNSLNAIDVLEESLQFFEVPDEKIEDFLTQ
ncbi:MAG: Na-translocating system protein MpsB, partial [Pirellula sp.]|nr:Na-translocating system protein MpsB [Pirellula sp.]